MIWTGLNLQEQLTPQITAIVPQSAIALNIYSGDIVDNAGNVTVSYTTYPNLLAQVQLEENQKMIHTAAYDITKIYKRFFIQSFTLTGLNRNINTGGDFITMDGLNYKIVEVNYNFKTGWVSVIANEGFSIDENVNFCLALNTSDALSLTPDDDTALQIEPS